MKDIVPEIKKAIQDINGDPGLSPKDKVEKIKALKTFGVNFGMSFQLIDDVIDYSSSFYKLGKNVGDDFKQGKVTLPVILAYLRSDAKEK